MDLSFLSNVKLEVVKPAGINKREAAPKLPTDADLRVFANGKVFPSEAFAAKYDLEFQPRIQGGTLEKPTYTTPGNGLDVFSSKKWGMIMGQLPTELIFCTVVPKSSPKVDMFAATKYNADNTPIASVFTQGASVFSKDVLVPMIADIYGINWDAVEYVDLVVATDNPLVSPNGVYHLPKVVSSGPLKGEDTYIRRENLTICPLLIKDTVQKTGETEESQLKHGVETKPELVPTTELVAETPVQQYETVSEVPETPGNAPLVGHSEVPAQDTAQSLFGQPQAPTASDTPEWAAGLGVTPQQN